jgi:hypothetical protein
MNRSFPSVLTLALTIAAVAAFPATGPAAAATFSGSNNQEIPGGKLDLGTYIVRWTSTGVFCSLGAADAAGNLKIQISVGDPKGESLLVVDNGVVKPGDIIMKVSSDGAWTLTITKADPASAVALPQSLAGGEKARVLSKPFKATAGNLAVTYAYHGVPRGTGTIAICDVATGQYLLAGMLPAGRASGEMSVKVPAAGVFIAKTVFPLNSGGGEVKISQ